jgi:tyrosine-protein kinase Etk/Wzc
MQFRANGRLYLGELEPAGRQPSAAREDIDLSGSEKGDAASEIEIITSRALVTRAILKSGLNVDIQPAGVPAPRYLPWLASKRDPRLLDAGPRELRATETDLGEEASEDAAYRVKFVDASRYELWSGTRRVGQGELGEPLSADRLKLTLVPGSERGPRAGAEYALTVRPLEDVRARVFKLLEVSVPKAASSGEPVKVVTLSFTDRSPLLGAAFLSTLMQGYLAERRTWKTENATLAEEFVTHQLAGIRESLDELQEKLASYRTKHRVVVLEDEAKALIEQVGKYEEQRAAARLQVAALSDIKKTLQSPDPPLGAYLLGESGDPVLQNLADSLSQAKQKLTDLDARFNPEAPELKQQRAQLNAQLEGIRNYVSSRLARAHKNEAAIGGIIGQFEGRLRTVPGAELGLTQLSRESEVYSRLYSYLLERQQEMAILKASTVSKNRVLDAPAPSYREDSPKLALRAASFPVGLLFGVLVLVARALLRDGFQSEAELKKSLGSLPIFASVPHKRKMIRTKRATPRSFPLPFEPPEMEFEEAFRMLRANLYYSQPNGAPAVVLVTSPQPGDGKTTCSLALTALFAADGKRALIVDADVREPSHCLGHGAPSFEHALQGDCDWRDAVHRIATLYGEFDAIGASEGALPELLSSPAMAAFLAEARTVYDVIVLDGSSFPASSDALVLARMADCVLSVIRIGSTPRRLAAEHLHRVSLSCERLAVVANDLPRAKIRRSAPQGPHFPTSVSDPPIPLTRELQRAAGFDEG